ncbi:hypothetical protein [Microvirga sp. KLBC 81]|uniref:hypothetical protein n=1 Tax=Microvirga sp. KLBC 81 TaxID=1862707 RepID=UPI0010576989|nr:hypothetical protein [Microvirga sp. KLBC 81]
MALPISRSKSQLLQEDWATSASSKAGRDSFFTKLLPSANSLMFPAFSYFALSQNIFAISAAGDKQLILKAI